MEMTIIDILESVLAGRITPDDAADLIYKKIEDISLRDSFAGQAMQGLIISTEIDDSKFVASAAYDVADAMLEARK